MDAYMEGVALFLADKKGIFEMIHCDGHGYG